MLLVRSYSWPWYIKVRERRFRWWWVSPRHPTPRHLTSSHYVTRKTQVSESFLSFLFWPRQNWKPSCTSRWILGRRKHGTPLSAEPSEVLTPAAAAANSFTHDSSRQPSAQDDVYLDEPNAVTRKRSSIRRSRGRRRGHGHGHDHDGPKLLDTSTSYSLHHHWYLVRREGCVFLCRCCDMCVCVCVYERPTHMPESLCVSSFEPRVKNWL